MEKQYNNCNDVEKHIIHEYETWCKSEAPLQLKIKIATMWMERAIELNISHLLKP
jgi:hypothetical protein